MNDATRNSADQLSALMDGQLQAEEFDCVLHRLGHDQEARLTWYAYHLAGDVLRAGESMLSRHEAVFLQRVRLGVQAAPALPMAPTGGELIPIPRRAHRASNDASGGWKMWLGVASLVAVAAVGWQLVTELGEHQPPMQQASMIRDPQLDALLAAHRQSGGTPSLPLATGSLSQAVFQGGGR